MFGKSKRPKDTMSVKDMTRLDKRPLKYVTMRDPETYKKYGSVKTAQLI